MPVTVKICGITSEEDALLAVALGADAVGFVFAPSTRQVAAGFVASITRRLPPEVLTVGVFRDSDPQRVVEVGLRAGVRAVQLHGQESSEDTAQVAAHFPFVIKAFPAGDPRLDRVGDYHVHAVLLDGPEPGSGRLFDWRLATNLPARTRVFVAGGLTPGNVGEAVRRLRPFGVDVSSGVEQAPGRKDPRKLRAFVQAVRAAEPPADGVPGPLAHAGPYDWEDER